MEEKEMTKDTLVDVRNNCSTKLIYINPSTGNQIEWEDYGVIQPVELDELITMRNRQPAFFRRYWVSIVGENAQEAIKFARLSKYYENFPADIDEIVKWPLSKLSKESVVWSDEAKEIIGARMAALVNQGKIDSVKTVRKLSEALNINFEDQ